MQVFEFTIPFLNHLMEISLVKDDKRSEQWLMYVSYKDTSFSEGQTVIELGHVNDLTLKQAEQKLIEICEKNLLKALAHLKECKFKNEYY